MAAQQSEISVTAPLGLAFDRVAKILFRPFDLNKWLVIGFCAWLAFLGENGGGGGSGGWNNHSRNVDVKREWHRATHYVVENAYWLVPVVVAAIVVCVGLWVLLLWLNSRGKFMFLHCVALDRAEVAEPWHKFSSEANSLFVFQILLGLIGAAIILPMVALVGFGVYLISSHAAVLGMLMVGGGGLAIIAGAITLLVFRKLTMDFVVPIMFLHRKKSLDAWQEFSVVLKTNVASFVTYLAFQIVIYLVIGIAVLILMVATCCIAGCLLALPYLGTVLFLPVLVFMRAYSLYFLRQFGPEYDVFPVT
jgi:hypothetical protein